MSEFVNPLSDEAQQHYDAGQEVARLDRAGGQAELLRTRQLLNRFLPAPQATVLDVGGGTGVYAFWLAEQGYSVHLIDAMPLHIEQAREYAETHSGPPLARLSVGDARQLDYPDESADAVLLLGPLYHLIERTDRIKALREARRVLRPGGVVLAVGISRFASLLDGLTGGMLDDPAFAAIVRQDLTDGQHRNPGNHPAYFTTAFFHHPDELKAETIEAGFGEVQLLGIEGPSWLSSYAAKNWQDGEKQRLFLDLLSRVESEPTLLGVSAHLMAVGRKV